MDDTKITQLKAHLQWTLGRIDSLEWVRGNLTLSTADSGKLKEKVDKLFVTKREYDGKISAINEEAERKRAATKAQREADKLKRNRGY